MMSKMNLATKGQTESGRGRSRSGTAKGMSEWAAASLRSHIARHYGATLGLAIGVGILIGLVEPAVVHSGRRAS